MAIIRTEVVNGIRFNIVDDMPDLSNSATSRRWAEALKDFLRKHPDPETIEIDGKFNFVPFNRRISEKISSKNLEIGK